MVKVFGDETCTHRGAEITAVAIYFATPESWRKFKKPWRKCLKKFGVAAYHAVDLENREGEFKDWPESKKSKFVESLLPIVPKYTEQGISCAALNSDTLRWSKELESVRKEFRKDELPYLFCLLRLVKILGSGLVGRFARDRMTFVFEYNQFSSIAEKCFYWLRRTENFGDRLAAITFASKNAAPQLQAADALAFQTYLAMHRWWIQRKPPQPTQELTILNMKKTVGMLSYPMLQDIKQEISGIAELTRKLRNF